MKKIYSLTLDPQIVEEFRAYAKSENRTMSNMIETIMKEVNSKKKGGRA